METYVLWLPWKNSYISSVTVPNGKELVRLCAVFDTDCPTILQFLQMIFVERLSSRSKCCFLVTMNF